MAISKNKKAEKKCCSRCTEEKPNKDFYMSSDDLINNDGRLGICKVCLEEITDFNDVESFIDILRRIDRPFIKSEYETSLSYNNPLGEYMRRIGMPQNRKRTYMDSIFDGDLNKFAVKTSKDLNKKIDVEDVVKFKITPDLIVKWGSGYNEAELFVLEEFYKRMETSNSITTPQHKENLKLLCKLNLKQNKALDDGDSGTFAKLNTQYNNILRDSGFRPIDKVSGGESSGVRTFGQIWEEIERDGFIEPYPYQEKQDIVDRTIMYMGNYLHKLLNIQTMSSPPSDTPNANEKGEEDEL